MVMMASSYSKGEQENLHNQIVVLSKDEFLAPIHNSYIKRLSQTPAKDLVDNYNPGSTKEDGSINFECHCVSHLVASPCGHEFREAISCQKAANEEELSGGKCAEEFVAFMNCTMKTNCFKETNKNNDKKD